MVIGTIGSGNVGGALARFWTAAGHTVRVAGREGGKEALAGADVIALCVPWSAAETVIASCGDCAGKILIDCTNPITERLDGLALGGTTSAAERIQALQPRASVVKAFNSVGAAMLGNRELGADGFYCGDDPAAKQVVGKLIAATGLRAVDVGPLRNARYLEAMAMLWIDMAVNQRRGPTFAFRLTSTERS